MRGSLFQRPGALFAAAIVVGVTASCSKIVGIEDTTVESQAGAGASAGGAGGRGGAAGNPSNGGGGSAGAATGGGAGGTDAAGKGGSAQTSGGTGGTGAKGGGGGTGGDNVSGAGGAKGGTGGTGGATGGAGGSGGAAAGAGGVSATGGSSGTDAAGGDGTTDPCGGVTARCTNGMREECTNGDWQASPCGLETPTCDNGDCIVRGPTLVSAGDYYIDATEVTVAQYKEFTKAKGTDTSGQSSTCSWNTDYAPSDDPGALNLPVSYVDWCDAAAFCKWADKHLCSGIGGIALTVDNLFNVDDSQWFQACGGGGTHPQNNAECNSKDGAEDTAPVATFPKCEGYYPGLFDMEGNVAEWVDLCDSHAGADDMCHALGGSTIDAQSYCTEDYDQIPRNTTGFTIGFRCCSG